MPRAKKRDLDFTPEVDATNQDIVDAVEEKVGAVEDELKETTQGVEDSKALLEQILGDELER